MVDQLQSSIVAAHDPAFKAATSFFQGGWRPFIGWVCLFGFMYQFLVLPPLSWYSLGWLHVPPPPPLDVTQLIGLLGATGMIAGLRTMERINGVIPPLT